MRLIEGYEAIKAQTKAVRKTPEDASEPLFASVEEKEFIPVKLMFKELKSVRLDLEL